MLLYVIAILFLAYAMLLLYYWKSWTAIPLYKSAGTSNVKLSVIIPARNEEDNIGGLLQALDNQTYPPELFEVIVVDDQSADATAAVVKTFPKVNLVSLSPDPGNSQKKKAITAGIEAARGELIITTDADCLPGPKWLETLASFYTEKKTVAIAAPVVIDCSNCFIEIFQCMDFMVLQGITGATVHRGSMSMANGANLAYQRKAFDAVGGFSGIDTVASGDDMLLVYKIAKQFPGGYRYCLSEEAIVTTQPLRTIKDFFSQRKRWASKSTHYQDKRILPVLILVYLFNLSFLSLLIIGFINPFYWFVFLIAWIAKTLVELPFYSSVARFFKKSWTIPLFFLSQPLHIFYTIVVGIASQGGSYQWKGRKVK